MEHDLKTGMKVFTHVYNGLKDFELRKNDRNFKESDTLILRETENSCEEMSNGSKLVYTGREIECEVTYVMHGPFYGLMDGWVIMGIEVVKHSSTPIRKR